MKLNEILEKNNHYSFKGIAGTDKEKQHYYVSEFYEEAFAPYQSRKINVFEVGINTGGSLLLWRDYFTNGQVYGVDPHYKLTFPIEDYKNIIMYFEDGYNQGLINRLPGIDIAIDDGPHTLDSQNNFIKLYLPKLNQGGLLVVEDIPNMEWIETFRRTALDTHPNTSFKIVDTREKYNQFDNIIFAAWKN